MDTHTLRIRSTERCLKDVLTVIVHDLSIIVKFDCNTVKKSNICITRALFQRYSH